MSITTPPQSIDVLEGNSITLSCGAYGTVPIRFEWFKTVSTTPLGLEQEITPSTTTSREATVTSTVTLDGDSGDSGMYNCQAYNNLTTAGDYFATSATAQVTVVCKDISFDCVSCTHTHTHTHVHVYTCTLILTHSTFVLHNTTHTAINITSFQATVTGVSGRGVTLEFTITASPPVSLDDITWYRIDDPNTPLEEDEEGHFNFGNDRSSLYIYPLDGQDEGTYRISVRLLTGDITTADIRLEVEGVCECVCVRMCMCVCVTDCVISSTSCC